MAIPAMAIVVRVNRQLVRGLFWLAMCVITALSLLPLRGSLVFSWQDKLEHAIAYAVLFALAKVAYAQKQPVWLLALALVGYGAMMEFAQGLTGYRSADIYDIYANTTGVLIAWLLTQKWIKVG